MCSFGHVEVLRQIILHFENDLAGIISPTRDRYLSLDNSRQI